MKFQTRMQSQYIALEENAFVIFKAFRYTLVYISG